VFRKVLYILSTIGILFPADLGVHVLQTPLMWAHYQEALAEHPELTFTDFLDFHTSEEAHHQGGEREHEEDVPCHHHHAVQSTAPVFVSQEPASMNTEVLEPEDEIQFGERSLVFTSTSFSSVWNPPRFS